MSELFFYLQLIFLRLHFMELGEVGSSNGLINPLEQYEDPHEYFWFSIRLYAMFFKLD